MDNSNHQGPMDKNSTAPWSTEWDWVGYVPWAGTLVNMGASCSHLSLSSRHQLDIAKTAFAGTYPGSWSQGLSYPAAQHLAATPCPAYPSKLCGLEGQVRDMLAHGVDGNGQLSPGINPAKCEPNGTMTANGWTQDALSQFLDFLTANGVRSVTLWFDNALQLYQDSFTCPWFVPTLHDWVAKL